MSATTTLRPDPIERAGAVERSAVRDVALALTASRRPLVEAAARSGIGQERLADLVEGRGAAITVAEYAAVMTGLGYLVRLVPTLTTA